MDLLNEFPTAHAIVAVACRNGTELNSGEPIARMTEVLSKLKNPSQLLAIGINCTPPQHVESLLRKLDAAAWPKAVYPNSGEGWDGVNKKWLLPTARAAPARGRSSCPSGMTPARASSAAAAGPPRRHSRYPRVLRTPSVSCRIVARYPPLAIELVSRP